MIEQVKVGSINAPGQNERNMVIHGEHVMYKDYNPRTGQFTDCIIRPMGEIMMSGPTNITFDLSPALLISTTDLTLNAEGREDIGAVFANLKQHYAAEMSEDKIEGSQQDIVVLDILEALTRFYGGEEE